MGLRGVLASGRLGSPEIDFGVPGGDAREPRSKSLKPVDGGLSSVEFISLVIDG